MKANILHLLILFVALVVVSCDKEENNALFGYEFALTELDGMVHKSSEYFREDTKESLTKDIYYEGGVYWAKGKKAKTELLDFFQSILESWHNEFGSADSIGFTISFPPFGNSTTKSTFIGSKADNEIKLDEKDVLNFEREFKMFVNMSYDESVGVDASFKEYTIKLLNALNDFKSNPNLDSYKSLKETVILHSAKEYIKASIDLNSSVRRDVEILLSKLNKLFAKYDNIFIKVK